MDRQFVIEFIKKLLNIIDKDIWNEDELITFIDELKLKEYTHKTVGNSEAQLLSILFTKYPFYVVPRIIMNLKEKLANIETDDIVLKPLTLISGGYLDELSYKVESRVIIEMDAHIYRIAREYYQRPDMESSEVFNILQNNIYEPFILSGLSCFHEESFQQQSFMLPRVSVNNDKVSIHNYNRRIAIQRNVITILSKYYTIKEIDDLECFIFQSFIRLTENVDDVTYLVHLFKTRMNYFKEEVAKKCEQMPSESNILKFINYSS